MAGGVPSEVDGQSVNGGDQVPCQALDLDSACPQAECLVYTGRRMACPAPRRFALTQSRSAVQAGRAIRATVQLLSAGGSCAGRVSYGPLSVCQRSSTRRCPVTD